MTTTRNPAKPVEPRRGKMKHLVSSQAQHAGLWLDKYLPNEDRLEATEKRDEKPKQRLVKQTAKLATPEIYAEFYKRWQATLTAAGAQCRTATVQGRMVIGLGDESVLETSVRLHQTYGVPYIPGSALKGLAASFVRNRLSGTEWGYYDKDGKQQWKGSKVYEVVFGDTDHAGHITFFDALYVPESGYKNEKGKPQALYPDVITVHHPNYYRGDKDAAPADWDSPIPVPFLSATGAYCVALGGPSAWVDVTFDLLQHALREMGVGAKTSSGYGRLALAGKPIDPAQREADALITRINALPIRDVTSRINSFYQQWQQLTASDALKRLVAQAIIRKVAEAGREKQSFGKPWYEDLVASIQSNPGG